MQTKFFGNPLRTLTLMLYLCSALVTKAAYASEHFNILLYHHVDASTPPSTSVSPEVFANHMAFLKAEGYNVINLYTALNAIQNSQPLPEKSVAITFDDAWRNIYDNAVPIMEQYGFSYTIFINTDFVDENHRIGMTWDMLRDIKKRGGILANHTRDHDYMVRDSMQDKAWLEKARANILHAQSRLEDETGNTPKWLAYPYGEYNDTLKDTIKAMGYIGFGQHSGGVAAFSDWQALPRFPAAGIYSDIKKLKIKLNSQPLPVDYAALPNVLIFNSSTTQPDNLINPPTLQGQLVKPFKKSEKARINCFILGQSIQPTWRNENTWAVKAKTSLPLGRSRYNCTAPVAGQSNYYWFSQQWLVQ